MTKLRPDQGAGNAGVDRSDAVASIEALDLLSELLGAFGLAAAQRALWDARGVPDHDDPTTHVLPAASRRELVGVPSHPEEYAALHARERVAALPTLRALTPEVREILRPRTLPRPDAAYRAQWQSIITRWNEAVHEQRLVTLPTLCTTCGRPVLRRANRPGSDKRSVECCDQHRRARLARTRSVTRKIAEATSADDRKKARAKNRKKPRRNG